MEWKDIIQILGEMQIGQILVIGFMMWFFYNRLDTKIEKITNTLRDDIKQEAARIDQQTARTDKLYEMFIDLLKEQKSPKTNP